MPKIPTQTPAPFELYMSDDALVTFDKLKPNGTQKFDDTGYMAVNQNTIAGLDIPDGLNGMFIHYAGSGVQAADGSIDYKKLHYELVGYKGVAQFGHEDGTGTPTVSGILDQIVLAQGDLIKDGHHVLAFGSDAAGNPIISGQLDVSIQIGNKTVGELDIKAQHNVASDLLPAPGGFTLDGGTLHAIFVPLSGG